jgi:hypothetical protein
MNLNDYSMSILAKIVLALLVAFYALFFWSAMTRAHDAHNPEHDEWYRSLMQPDNPAASCCGLADAYWADKIIVRGTKTFVVIEDDRDDAMLGRPHIPNGTEVYVPNHKLKWDAGNPTGHGVIFMRGADTVFCYVQASGI